MRDVWIGLEERDERGSEFGVPLCELERQRGEDELEITAILDAPRAEKRGTQTAVGEQPFCDRLRDRGLSRPSESIEPEDGRPFEILDPALNLIQHTLSSPLETPSPIPMPMSCPMRPMATIQNQFIGFETRRLAYFNFRSKGV